VISWVASERMTSPLMRSFLRMSFFIRPR
jgi:hypothetical protein